MTILEEKTLIAKNKKKKKSSDTKRKRKSRYKTGFHFSLKCKNPNNILQYRSGWEKIFAVSLDMDPNVISYEYETLKIPYIKSVKTGKQRWYIPDFIVTYVTGPRMIVEIKNTSVVNNSTVQKKAKAADAWAKRNNYQYVMLTGPAITMLEKLQNPSKNSKKQSQ